MIYLGPAGIGSSSTEGMQEIKDLGLDGVEVEFTYGVRMSNATAKELGEAAKKLKLRISVHAPYYINLASNEIEKREASIRRIIQSCERGHYLNAKYIVFHAAFYMKRDKEEVYQIVRKAVLDIQEVIKKNKWRVKLAPETTGKKTQFGDIDELLRLHKETGCSFCVDFAHLLARDGRVDYDEILEKLKGLKEIHCHYSGIVFSDKGERRHKLTDKKDIKALFSKLLKTKIDFMIINESPDPIGDSLKSKKVLDELK